MILSNTLFVFVAAVWIFWLTCLDQADSWSAGISVVALLQCGLHKAIVAALQKKIQRDKLKIIKGRRRRSYLK